MKGERDTRKVEARLASQSYKIAEGKGDHRHYYIEGIGRVTIDRGKKELDRNAYKKLKEKMGW